MARVWFACAMRVGFGSGLSTRVVGGFLLVGGARRFGTRAQVIHGTGFGNEFQFVVLLKNVGIFSTDFSTRYSTVESRKDSD